MGCRVALSEICDINASQYSTKEAWPRIQYLDTGNVTRGVISELQQLDPLIDKVPGRARRKVKPNSIVYSMVRPNQGHYALLKNPPVDMLVSTGFSVIDADESQVLPSYLYYALTTKGATEGFQTLAEQSVSTYPTLSSADLLAFEVALPPLKCQQQVAAVLERIDEKIAVNAKLNGYLLEMAKVIYRQWFVGDTAKYPTTTMKLSDIATINAGGDKPKDVSQTIQPGFCVPIYSNGTDNEGLYGFTSVAKINEPSVTVSARGTIGFTCLRRRPYYPIVRLISATPKRCVTAEYLYLWLLNTSVVGVGTTQQQLTVPMFKAYGIKVPEAKAMEQFSQTINPLFDAIDSNKEECIKLAALRDVLLPRLMSGEIDVQKVAIGCGLLH